MLTLTPQDDDLLEQSQESLSARVTRLIGQKIVRGELEAGASLQKESDLGALMGVSRTVVREAVKVLVSKGLLSTRQKAGILVNARSDWNLFDPDILLWLLKTGPSREVLVELSEFRLSLEPAAARLVAERGMPAALEPIAQALQAMQKAQSKEAYYHADLAFHAALFDACPNVFMRQLKAVVQVVLQGSFQLQAQREDRSEGTRHHAQLFHSLKNRDGARAEATMRYLIYEAREELLSLTRGTP